jgi:hypothetical protein
MKTALKQVQKKSQGASSDKKLEVLSAAYEQAMERINGQQAGFQLLARNVLSWITCAKRPLLMSELQHAIAVEIGEPELDEDNLPEIEDMVSVCAGLVVIDEESNIIRLVHYTTQEYFERTQSQWFPYAQTDITTICITYLSFKEFDNGTCQNDEEFEQRLQLHKLYDYAAHNWGYHAREASKLIPEVISFLERTSQVKASSQVLLVEKINSFLGNYSQGFPKDIRGLHLAAYFGVVAVVKLLLDKQADVDSKDGDGRTPLWWAAENGHEAVVKLLLDKQADVDSKDGDGRTPLSWAAENGHEAVVKLLLRTGLNISTLVVCAQP